jgi:Arc/MetJ family transcription regulator
MPGFNKLYPTIMKIKYSFLLLAISLLLQPSCTKIVEKKRYTYQIQDQELYQTAAQKLYLKTTDQFISIAYTHLFGVSITNNELNQYNVTLQALGDKATMQDMIVKSMINRSGVQLVTDAAMRADINAFVEQTYLRFYNRKPNEFEQWKMKDIIEKNTDITPKAIYYSMMTANEYRYY